MSSYRFCRTDDVSLLVEAIERCWRPYARNGGATTVESFKREIRDLQVWCSSCMVAAEGADPVGVLIGAKRERETRIVRLGIHPDHRRKGHGRHLLASLSSKLAILGPPRLVAEVPEEDARARAFFEGCGYVPETTLVDWVLASPPAPAPPGLLVPVSLDDLEGLGALPPEAAAWERGLPTLRARKETISGLALAGGDALLGYVLFRTDSDGTREIVALSGSEEPLLARLLGNAAAGALGELRFPKVAESEHTGERLARLGFRAGRAFVRHAATAAPA